MDAFSKQRLTREIRTRFASSSGGELIYQHAATGRTFAFRGQADGSCRLSECLPARPEDRPVVDLIRENPNTTHDILRRHGIDGDDLLLAVEGYSVGTIYHANLEAAIDALVEAIDRNVVVQHYLMPAERAERLGAVGMAREAVTEAESSVAYWKAQLGSVGRRGTILEGARGLLGPLDDAAKNRILAFLNAPGSETWEGCYSIIVDGRRTLWNIWCDNDPAAPQRRRGDHWPRVPEPDRLIDWLRAAPGERERMAAEKLQAAQDALRQAKSKLSSLEKAAARSNATEGPGFG